MSHPILRDLLAEEGVDDCFKLFCSIVFLFVNIYIGQDAQKMWTYKQQQKETHTVTFSHSVYPCNLINKIVTSCGFVTKLEYDISEYPYWYCWTISTGKRTCFG